MFGALLDARLTCETHGVIKVPVGSLEDPGRTSVCVFTKMAERAIKVVTLDPEENVDVGVNTNINL